MGRAINLQIAEQSKKLKKLLFKVELLPIALKIEEGPFSNLDRLPICDYSAVVNVESTEVLCVVSKEYQLVTNAQAITWGIQLFGDIFQIKVDEELKPFKVMSSKRGTFCHIDLVHETYDEKVFEQDTWLPFIRITNSYNRTHLLSYKIGFVRKLCSNGMLFDSRMIHIKQSHSNITIGDTQDPKQLIPNYNKEIEKIRLARADFVNTMNGLFKLHIPGKLMADIVRHLIPPNYPITHIDRAIQEKAKAKLEVYNAIINNLINEYKMEHGESAYCVLNVLTDLVTHGDEYGCISSFTTRAPYLQHNILEWAQAFPIAMGEKTFRWESYIQSLLKPIKQ